MNDKEKELQELEKFYNNALVVNETSIIYKEFMISKTRDGLWRLDKYLGRQDILKALNPNKSFPQHVKIPDFIQVIGTDSFEKYKERPLSVKIPNGVQIIEKRAFTGCYLLEGIKLPSSLKEIGNEAFSDCMLGQIYIPDNVEIIGREAFSLNSDMKSLSIPKDIYVGDWAFRGCGLKVKESEATFTVRDKNGNSVSVCDIKQGCDPFRSSVFNCWYMDA